MGYPYRALRGYNMRIYGSLVLFWVLSVSQTFSSFTHFTLDPFHSKMALKSHVLEKNVSSVVKKKRQESNHPKYIEAIQYYKDAQALFISNPAESVQKFKIASELGHIDALYRYGICLLSGFGVEKNRDKGIISLKAAANFGHPYAIEWVCQNFNGQKEDLTDTPTGLGCEEQTKLVYDIALRHLDEKNIQFNPAIAQKCLQKAAKNNCAPAQYKLGLTYPSGVGVKKNSDVSFYLLQKAAEQNHADAQYKLALHYLMGGSAVSNYGKALYWMIRSFYQYILG
ncbi:MAG: hypothetical protein C0432_04435 [Candidatus Puniceispirillum sp.]|nr:hypothetical protein [Candidatus Pelagibacter sp.]MBA4283523.1 hypothetical protein [Candidatus Puniceispirillum sp.]